MGRLNLKNVKNCLKLYEKEIHSKLSVSESIFVIEFFDNCNDAIRKLSKMYPKIFEAF